MHELSIAQGLVETAAGAAAEHGAARINRVHLRLGTLTAVEADALLFCWPMAAAGTRCEGAELVVVPEPARGTCPTCRTTRDVMSLMDACDCGQWPLALEGGRDLRLESLEVD